MNQERIRTSEWLKLESLILARHCLTSSLSVYSFASFHTLQDDPTTRRWLQQLVHNVSGANRMAALQAAGLDHMLGN